jgi:hypothetical protein
MMMMMFIGTECFSGRQYALASPPCNSWLHPRSGAWGIVTPPIDYGFSESSLPAKNVRRAAGKSIAIAAAIGDDVPEIRYNNVVCTL